MTLRRINREKQKEGEQILTEWLKTNDREMDMAVVSKLCALHGIEKPDDLFLNIGKKTITLGNKELDALNDKKKENAKTWRKFVPFLGNSNKDIKKNALLIVEKGFNKKKPVIISEETIDNFIYPGCCHPIPGDDILGYIDNQNRIEIHIRVCKVADKLKTSFGNKILDAKWDMHKQMFFDATIEIRGIDRKGMLHDVADVISDKMDINIHKVTISSDDGIFDGLIELRVHDRSEVKEIMKSLKKINGLQEVLQTQ